MLLAADYSQIELRLLAHLSRDPAFVDAFHEAGFSAKSFLPSYGLAEATLAVTVPPLGRGPLIDRVEREIFASQGHALPAPPEDEIRFPDALAGAPS